MPCVMTYGIEVIENSAEDSAIIAMIPVYIPALSFEVRYMIRLRIWVRRKTIMHVTMMSRLAMSTLDGRLNFTDSAWRPLESGKAPSMVASKFSTILACQ